MTETAARKPRALTSDRVKTVAPAARIVEQFGGLSRFCELCDFAHGTVHGWMVTGLIPSKTRQLPNGCTVSYARWILIFAAANEIKLTEADFVDLPGQLDSNG